MAGFFQLQTISSERKLWGEQWKSLPPNSQWCCQYFSLDSTNYGFAKARWPSTLLQITVSILNAGVTEKEVRGTISPVLLWIKALSWFSPPASQGWKSQREHLILHASQEPLCQCKTGENKIHQIWKAASDLPPPTTSTCPIASKRCTEAPKKRMRVQIEYYYWNH